jgi:hypothetical protein
MMDRLPMAFIGILPVSTRDAVKIAAGTFFALLPVQPHEG